MTRTFSSNWLMCDLVVEHEGLDDDDCVDVCDDDGDDDCDDND